MIAPLIYQPIAKINIPAAVVQSSGLNRMFAAAIVNQQFRELLLSNPQKALQNGYLGETFSLTKEEQDLIVSIRAHTLSELARQINKSLAIK
ncbi:MAG: hypothetical protein U0Z26_17660 [Anaerolineales bacterium]